MTNFTHLHCHSHYSFLDGASKIDKLVARCKEYGMDSLALTDHSNLHGAIEFYKECRKQGINPILGYEAYVVGDRRNADDSNYHLTILAKNRTGYRNLLRLSSLAFLEGFYRKPRIDYDALQSHAEGLIVLSGCMSSRFAELVGDKAEEDALKYLHKMQSIFPEFYVEIQRNGKKTQEYITDCTIDFATRHGLPMVATGDLHYVDQQDAEVQDVLMCVSTGARRSNEDRFRLEGQSYYLRTPEQMEALFSDQLEAVHQSAQISSGVDLELSLGTRYFPVYRHNCLPACTERRDSNSCLLEGLVAQGLEERIPGAGNEYRQRLQRELSVIKELGFVDYFLIVHDFVNWANQRGIISSARGSGVGSLVCYCLKISHVDPIKYDLLFERFLDLNRREAPDIDIDFDKERRAEVMMYVKERYGHNAVAQIGTFGRMGAKQALKDVARVEGYPLGKVEELTKKVSDMPGTTLNDTDFGEVDSTAQAIIDMAKRCEGTARQLGTHAAAVVIAPGDLQDYVPLARLPGKSEIITQWDMYAVEDAGLLKMDFLGLRNMTILNEAIQLIHQTTGEWVDIHKIPFDDNDTWDLLCRGETMGLFQLESPGMSSLLVRMQPRDIEHIIATIALFRPGPLDAGMVDEYINVKNGEKIAHYPHPSVESVLGVTYGVMVYQEQVMQVVHCLGGIPLDEAYSCVKAISKKLPDKMVLYRDRFVKGCSEQGVDGAGLWEQIKTFARYGFNRSHSAAYAFVAYQTAWLKAHYPVEFLAAILNADIPDRNFKRRDRLYDHLGDCKRMGIEVRLPSINEGFGKFRVVGGKILFGLGAIKGVSPDIGDRIGRRRDNGAGHYDSLLDFFSFVTLEDCPRAALRALIQSGACDCWPGTRAQKIDAMDRYRKVANFGYKTKSGADNALVLKEIEATHLDELNDERAVLGFYVSGHPTEYHRDTLFKACSGSPADVGAVGTEQPLSLGGLISGVRQGQTKDGDDYMGFTIEDWGGSCDAIMWRKTVHKYGKLVKDGAIVVLHGYVSERSKARAISSNLPPSLTVTKVVPIAEAEPKAQLILHADTPEQLDECHEILCAAPGEHKVHAKVFRYYLTFDRGVDVTPGLVDRLSKILIVEKKV